MADQSSPPPGPPDAKNKTSELEISKATDENRHDMKGDVNNDSSAKPSFLISEPIREDQVHNAVNFLSHPKVRGSPVVYRRSFLEKKGLTREEIDEAFRRVPDPPSDAANVEAAAANQGSIASQPKPPTRVDSQAPMQNPQAAAGPSGVVSMVPSLQQSGFHWSHALAAIGVLAASGAGSAVLFQRVVVPRFKAWIRRVVAEERESEDKAKSSSKLAEEAAEAAKAAASSAALAAKASEELLNSKNKERTRLDELMEMIDIQTKEMRAVGSAVRNLEDSRGTIHYQEKDIGGHVHSTTGNGTTNNSWRASKIDHSDASFSSTVPMQVKVNGKSDSNYGAARPSSAAVSVEPINAPPHPKSYMEIMAMVHRGETPPGIKEINDMPPNPNQQPSKSVLPPRPKPWAVAQQTQQWPNSGPQSQGSGDDMVYKAQVSGPGFYENQKPPDASGTWWKKKSVRISEIEPEVEDLRQPYDWRGGNEQQTQLGWMPPQPPAVMEAAAAMRQPRPPGRPVQKQLTGDDWSSARPEDGEHGAVRAFSPGTSEQQIQHSWTPPPPWIPPQPPAVVMPEAAAAIRRPKQPVQKQLSGDDPSSTRSDDGNEDGASGSSGPGSVGEASGSAAAVPIQSEIHEETADGIEAN